MALIDELRDVVAPVLIANGYRLYDIKMQVIKKETYLIVLVEKGNKRLDINEIVEISEPLSVALDEADLIKQAYILDVGSAGAEKTLRLDELSEYLNEYVLVKLKTHQDKLAEVYGQLINVTDKQISIMTKDKTRTKQVDIELGNVAHIRLAIKY